MAARMSDTQYHILYAISRGARLRDARDRCWFIRPDSPNSTKVNRVTLNALVHHDWIERDLDECTYAVTKWRLTSVGRRAIHAESARRDKGE